MQFVQTPNKKSAGPLHNEHAGDRGDQEKRQVGEDRFYVKLSTMYICSRGYSGIENVSLVIVIDCHNIVYSSLSEWEVFMEGEGRRNTRNCLGSHQALFPILSPMMNLSQLPLRSLPFILLVFAVD